MGAGLRNLCSYSLEPAVFLGKCKMEYKKVLGFFVKGSFKYYVITKGEGGFGMITLM